MKHETKLQITTFSTKYLTLYYLQQWRKADRPYDFEKTRVLSVVYLHEENKSIKLQMLWKVKLSLLLVNVLLNLTHLIYYKTQISMVLLCCQQWSYFLAGFGI